MRSYRASSLGSCTRAQIAVQLGMATIGTSDQMESLYQRGRDHEVECLAAMEADGWIFYTQEANMPHDLLWDQQQFYIELEVAGAKVTGHLDGVAETRNGDRVLEIKSPISFAKWERAHKTGDYSDPLMHRYAWQASVYMVATGLEAVVACVQDGQVRTFGIETPPFSLEAITDRVARMEYGVTHPEYDPVGMMVCSQADYPCPVAYLHDRPDVIEDEVLDELLGDYAEWKKIKDDADSVMKRIRDSIDAHLGLSDSLTTAAGTVTRYTTTRKKYDMDAIADVLKDYTTTRLEDFTTTSASTSIRVTPKVDGDKPGA